MDWQALQRDAEDYWTRNLNQHHPDHDPIEPTLDRIHAHTPIRAAFEIGASDGWRLTWMREKYHCQVDGIDASHTAVQHATLPIRQGIAPISIEQTPEDSHDLVILGFFAYLLDPSQQLRLAAAIDRILQPGGHIILIDFLTPYPTRSDYTHSPRLNVWKQNLSELWTATPRYVLVDRTLINHPAHDIDHTDPNRWITVDAIRQLPTHHAYATREAPPSRTQPTPPHTGPETA